MKTSVNERIHGYLKKEGLKQRVIALKAGYTEKQFSALMTGRKKLLGEDVERICYALNVSSTEFIKPEEVGEEMEKCKT